MLARIRQGSCCSCSSSNSRSARSQFSSSLPACSEWEIWYARSAILSCVTGSRAAPCVRGISFPCARPYFRLFRGVGIVFHCSLMIARTLAQASLDPQIILVSVTQKGEGVVS